MLRETKQSQGTVALFVWFVFFNTQLLMGLFLFVYWRMHSPKSPLSEMLFWNPVVVEEPLILILMAMGMVSAGVGLGLGFRYYAAVKQASEKAGAPKVGNELYLISLVLCEMTGIYGVLIGLLRGPATIGIPFLLAAMGLIGVLFPSGGRFPKPR